MSKTAKKHAKLVELLSVIFGSAMVAFAVCTIHSRTNLTEGGLIGIELLCLRWFGIDPSITAIITDVIFYILGFLILNKKFRVNAVVGTLTYSATFFITESLGIVMPFVDNLLISAIVGALLVGIGSGLVVRNVGACGSDDSLALILNKLTKIPLAACYIVFDLIVILIALSYLSIEYLPYSLLTSIMSSIIIDLVSHKKLAKLNT